MNHYFNSIIEAIGETPLIKLSSRLGLPVQHNYFAKVEYFNPGGSIKDRVALGMVEEAERRGDLKPGGTLIEATSGNTGVGLALVAAVKGYQCIFTMPEKMSQEKRALLSGYGAKVVITPMGVEPEDPMSHYSVARRLAEKIPGAFLVNQYHNKDNPQRHYETTGPEIWKQSDGQVDMIVAGAGTGGTLSGCARYLKEMKKSVKAICADPYGSILYDLYYHKKVVSPPAPYKVEGVGEDMLPDNVHLDVYDGFVQINDQEAFDWTLKLVKSEGLLLGPSSGMALAGAIKATKDIKETLNVVVIFPDNGRAYLSKAFNKSWMIENGLTPKEEPRQFNEIVSAENVLKEYQC